MWKGSCKEPSLFVDVDDCETCAPTEPVAAKEIVVANRDVEQIAWSNARRVVVVVFCARCRYLRYFEPYCEAGQVPIRYYWVVGVA